MGQFRRRPEHPGNIIDQLTQGIGHRYSSLSDVDRLTIVHDGKQPPRFLFQELKWEREPVSGGQSWWLRDLAALPRVSVWLVRLLDDQRLRLSIPGTEDEDLTQQGYRTRFGRWWNPAEPGRMYPLEREVSW